jgi:DNA invertase Pin-like site-specific DNA recombinase
MLIGYARVSTDEQHLQLHPDQGIRFLLGLARSFPLPQKRLVVDHGRP